MTLLTWAAHNTLGAAALAAVALLVSRAVPRRPALSHALWMLVLLKLVAPPLVGVPVWTEEEPAAVATCPAETPHVAFVEGPVVPPPAARWGWADYALAAWAAGALAYWALAAWRLVRLHRLLAALPDAGLTAYVADLAGRLGLRRVPRVVLAAGPLPPLLAAIAGRPVLVLPGELWGRLDDAQRRALVLHELAHLARGDHHVRRLELLVLGLLWWNPLAWLAAAQLRRVEERCCDAWVVWASPDDAPAYASVLVETLAFLAARPACLPAGASGAGPVVDVRRRLSMILHGNTPRRLSRPALLLVLALGLGLLPLTPTRAQPAAKPADTVERLIASQKSCQLCHAPPAKREPGMTLHDDIVRMMDELRKMKKDLADKEKRLNDALKKFDKEVTPPKKVSDEERRKLTEEQAFKNWLRERFEKKIAPPTKEKPQEQGGTIHAVITVNSRSIRIPVQSDPELTSPIRLLVSTDRGKTWKVAGAMKERLAAFSFEAPADGEYWFAVQGGEEPPLASPGLRLLVDTKDA